MFRTIKNLTIKHKLFIPNVLYLGLFSVVIFFFFNSSALIEKLSEKQKSFNHMIGKMQDASISTRGYLNREIPYADLEKRFTKLLADMTDQDLSADFEEIWDRIRRIKELRSINNRIESEINERVYFSMEQSNSYIKQISEKLADQEARSDVSTLERLVITGANVNTSALYEFKILFGKLHDNPGVKKDLLAYVDTMLENVENDIKRLSGTPLEGMARDAKTANLKIKQLTVGYVKNREEAIGIQKVVIRAIGRHIDEISRLTLQNNREFSFKIKSYFRNILIILIIATLLGIIISVLLSKSISGLLEKIISSFSHTSDQLASSAGQVASASQALAAGSSQQAASLEETSSSLEEMSSMTRQNANNAAQADNLMQEVNQVVRLANKSMDKLTTAMEEIFNASDETSKIIKTIDEIAFQTNLLALNAAVEAARAGQAGAGFAVVADEVRNLALRAADAARNTAGLIEMTVNRVKEGSDLVGTTNNEFTRVAESAAKVGQLVTEIAAASREQAQGIEHVNSAVTDMDGVVQQNAASAEQSASAAEEMSAQAEHMKAFVSKIVVLAGVGSDESLIRQHHAGALRDYPASSEDAGVKAAHDVKSESRQGVQVTSDRLVPFDDDDLEDF